MAFTKELEKEILNHVFGNTALNVPSTIYVGIHVGNTAPSGEGENIVEPTGGYQRVAITRNTTTFPTTANNQIKNGIEVKFPQATANWGTPTHWFLTNVQKGVAGEKIYLVGTIGLPKEVLSGDAPFFGANDLTVSLT